MRFHAHRFAMMLGFILALIAPLSFAEDGTPNKDHPHVLIQTTMGDILLELDAQKAPITASNFLRYVDEGFYNNTIFHRVIPNFMIQGGGMTPELEEKPTHDPIRNESDNGLQNLRGTIAMARTQQIHSATAQFFINLVDNNYLDYQPGRFGYAVFGKVIQGMDVVNQIASVSTQSSHGMDDVPTQAVVIEKISRQ